MSNIVRPVSIELTLLLFFLDSMSMVAALIMKPAFVNYSTDAPINE